MIVLERVRTGLRWKRSVETNLFEYTLAKNDAALNIFSATSGNPGSDGDEFRKIWEYWFQSGKSTHQDRLDTIRDAEKRYGIPIDRHNANGLKGARDYLTPGISMIVLETALLAKFNETIHEVLDLDAERSAGFENIEALSQRFDVIAADVIRVKAYIAAHTGL